MLFINTIAKHLRKPQGIIGLFVARKMVKMNHFVYPSIEQYLGMSPEMKILEIGFGPGVGVDYFATRYFAKVDGIDYSPLMVKAAARRNRKAIAQGNVNLQCGNFLEYPLTQGTYDRVLFANVTYFWNDLNEPFAKIYASLKPNGRLVFYMSNGELLKQKGLEDTGCFTTHDVTDVCAALEASGFVQVRANKIMDDSGNFLIVEATKPK